MTSDTKKQASLVKAVFGGEKGKELIEFWKEETRPVLLSCPREQDVLLGKQLHIESIEYFLNVSSADLKKLEQAESYEDDNDL